MQPRSSDSCSLPSKSVLWIEDEPADVAPIADSLKSLGYRVQFASTGRSGVLRARSDPFDAILVDLRLPDITGMEVLRLLGAAGVHAPKIVITGYGTLDTALQAGRIGATALLTKPLRPSDVAAALL